MKKLSILAVFAAFSIITACSNISKEDLGMDKKNLDASLVSSKDPLILPPNYNLRPIVPMKKAEASDELQSNIDAEMSEMNNEK